MKLPTVNAMLPPGTLLYAPPPKTRVLAVILGVSTKQFDGTIRYIVLRSGSTTIEMYGWGVALIASKIRHGDITIVSPA